MTVYIDLFFLFNLISDFFINCTCCILNDYKLHIRKILFLSFTGSAYAVASIFFSFLSSFIIVFLYSCFNVFFLFGKSKPHVYIKRLASYYFICAAAAGFGSFGAKHGANAVQYGKNIFFPLSGLKIAAAMLFVLILIKLLKKVLMSPKRNYDIVLKKDDISLSCIGFYDSGNTLTEPVSGRPVIIISEKAAQSFAGEPKIQISFNTVSDKAAVMNAIHIDELTFCSEKISVHNIYAGIGNIDEKQFDVLLHSDIHV